MARVISIQTVRIHSKTSHLYSYLANFVIIARLSDILNGIFVQADLLFSNDASISSNILR
jgi:hypothetical protein